MNKKKLIGIVLTVPFVAAISAGAYHRKKETKRN